MIGVDQERCDGCGACLAACPTAAIFLVEGKASVDENLCRECGACVTACPRGAVALSSSPRANDGAARLPALHAEPEVIQVTPQHGLVPRRPGALSVLGSVLAWAARELLPVVEDLLSGAAGRSHTGSATRGSRDSSTRAKGGQHQQRHRRRRGGP